MEVSLIGSGNEITSTLQEGTFNKFGVNVLILDKKNKLVTNQNNFIPEKMKVINHYESFLENTSILIIDLGDKAQALKIIYDWLQIKATGILILRYVYDLGFSRRLEKWFTKKNRQIEILIIPKLLPYMIEGQDKFIFYGGEYLTPITKKIRAMIAKVGLPLFIANREEIEIIYLSNMLGILSVRYLIRDLERIADRFKIDIETLKKGLTQTFHSRLLKSRISPQWICATDQLYSKYLNYNRKPCTSKQLLNGDKQWLIGNIERIIFKNNIQNVTIYGFNQAIIKKLNKLPVKKINIFSIEQEHLFISKKVFYYKDLYQAANGSDLIIILTNNDKIASISLGKLEKMVNRKLIIDQMNIFESDEVGALHWIYISKGRPMVNKNTNKWK